MTDESLYPWAKPFQLRCKAVKEPNPSGYWGRCDLRRGHKGDHALERGMEVPRWSTEWTWRWTGIDKNGVRITPGQMRTLDKARAAEAGEKGPEQ